MNMRNILAASLLCGIAFTLYAQQPVAPPPRPVNDAPANAEVLKLLRTGMPESVILNYIHAATSKFDTSIDALVVLKQAGATEAELIAIQTQGTAPADQPPAAAPADNGPSLAETMRFIQDKLNRSGKIAYVEFAQDSTNGAAGTVTFTYEISSVFADQNQCRLSMHMKETSNGRTTTDRNDGFSLRDVNDIVVIPYEQKETERLARNGHPELVITSTNPPLMALMTRHTDGRTYVLVFTDADLAGRVANAMQHAIELCGGGNKDKF
jgi:hypothetical protein